MPNHHNAKRLISQIICHLIMRGPGIGSEEIFPLGILSGTMAVEQDDPPTAQPGTADAPVSNIAEPCGQTFRRRCKRSCDSSMQLRAGSRVSTMPYFIELSLSISHLSSNLRM